MTFSNVKLIFAREVCDQLRDRRTLFMIAVLPILLYPLLGTSFFQIAQFMREQPTRILVVGAGSLTESSELFEDQCFAKHLFADPKLLKLHFAPDKPKTDRALAEADVNAQVQSGDYEAALYFPPDFSTRLDAFRKNLADRAKDRAAGRTNVRLISTLEVPSPKIFHNTAHDKSQLARKRLAEVLRRWSDRIGDDNLRASGISIQAIRPFLVDTTDVADARHRGGAMWSKVFPVLMLLWALTGAFYPAIDLCAGEKERGTLETLLSSPAQRGEIVLGKLLTVMLFSILTAILNLLSVSVTGWMLLTQLPGFGLPPPVAIAALLIALVPVAALFSALCLALAAFARSSKEGQYYLMPLLLVIMPLVILPMSPGVELNLGNSLIPITGVVLLLRSVLEGSYWEALQFSPAVAAVTLLACWMSIRWAIDQFNSESVLFRESERLDLGLWLRHLLSNRKPTPTVAAAVGCGTLILMIKFFLSSAMTTPSGFGGFVHTVLVTQLAVIAVPALLMTFLLTRSPRQTLLLKLPSWWAIPAAALLAVVLHPAANRLQMVVERLYPINESVRAALEEMQHVIGQANFWSLVLILGVVPALCEELAFRGFILSGFRHLGHRWRAIVYSALFFGLTHGVLQQSMIASLLGVVIGYLAVQSGSIFPGIAFHVLHNTLAVANSRIAPEWIPDSPLARMFVTPVDGGGCLFTWLTVVVGSLIGVLLLIWFGRSPCPMSAEESLEAAIERGEHDDLSPTVEQAPSGAVGIGRLQNEIA